MLLFIESELSKLSVWCNPLNTNATGIPINFSGNTEKSMVTDVRNFCSTIYFMGDI
jgi:phosphatidylinositol 4-kinase